ncbi:MAG TPA: DUF6056 family protein [Kofleriaceae bacterium]|nr:DUF6056 family protein [Kofleriaceae bacterium]
MASWAVPQLDDWYEVAWIDRHGFGLASVVDLARYNFHNYNPRIGEVLLLVLNGPRILHCVITPALQLGLLVTCFVLAHGAWPRATARDLARLIGLQALIWLVIPIPGVIYFYRPYTANYLFATCLQLSLLALFRLALTRTDAPRRAWLAPITLAWGVLAGMGNEHTGPTAIVAAIAFAAWAWRWHRARAWMICGVIGLAIGFALLVLAPGQSVRYAGLTSGTHPFRTMLARGIDGNAKFLGDYLVEVAPGVALVLITGLCAVARRRETVAVLSRAIAIRIALAIAAAVGIVATMFASPIVEDRLFFAPCVVTAIALAMGASVAWEEPRARKALVAGSTAVVVINAIGFALTYREVAERTQDRIATFERTGTEAIASVAPASGWERDHWQFGEDLRYAYLRELLSHRVFDMRAIELAGAPAWSQPNPLETTHVSFDFDPPLFEPVSVLEPDPPTQWAWMVRELREVWTELSSLPGHELRAIDATVTPMVPLPGNRRIHLVTWHGGAFERIDAHTRSDPQGWPYAWADRRQVPIEPMEAWIEACGRAWPGELARTDREVRVSIRYQCAGNHTIYLCDASECWLAWRYW